MLVFMTTQLLFSTAQCDLEQLYLRNREITAEGNGSVI
jgi:hypothetical protein